MAPQQVLAKTPLAPPEHDTSLAAFDGNAHFTAVAGANSGGRTGYQTNWAPQIGEQQRFSNIMQGIMPFSQANGYYDVNVAINLAVLAYFNVALVRNAINLMQDFSVSPLHIKCSNKTVKTFITKWFESIQLPNLMSQFFLEYYRSGNVFLYKFSGKIEDDKFQKLKTAFAAAKTPELPIRYIILNPMQIYLQVGPMNKSTYSKMLSTFEIERLQNPQTPEDKAMLKSFPPDIQKQIKQNAPRPFLFVPLDTSRLFYAFYRKQDYEPLAIPMVFPVLADIDFKLAMKQADLSLLRQLEQVFLLVTSGDRRDEHNPGIDPRKIANLQSIFSNQTIGRTLVADYTTEAKWVNPDLKDLLGHDKYTQVDMDIKEGLGSAFFGAEKFASAAIKAKIFVESLREGRRVFLDNFLRPEVKKVCEALGFKNIPILEFEDVNIEDQSAVQRVYTQMAQLGLLTDGELNQAIKTGILPEKEESLEHQKDYKKERDQGLYQPLVGGAKDAGAGANGRPTGSGKPMPKKKVGPIGTSRGSYRFSMKAIAANVSQMVDIQNAVEAAYKKAAKLKKLTPEQEAVALAVAKSIVVNEPAAKWQESVASYVKEPKNMPEEIGAELDEIGATFDTDGWTAIALYHSKIEQTE